MRRVMIGGVLGVAVGIAGIPASAAAPAGIAGRAAVVTEVRHADGTVTDTWRLADGSVARACGPQGMTLAAAPGGSGQMVAPRASSIGVTSPAMDKSRPAAHPHGLGADIAARQIAINNAINCGMNPAAARAFFSSLDRR